MSEMFYVVWAPARGHPKKRHETLLAAVNEAERLVNQEPGREFYVLAAVRRLSSRVEIQNEQLAENATPGPDQVLRPCWDLLRNCPVQRLAANEKIYDMDGRLLGTLREVKIAEGCIYHRLVIETPLGDSLLTVSIIDARVLRPAKE